MKLAIIQRMHSPNNMEQPTYLSYSFPSCIILPRKYVVTTNQMQGKMCNFFSLSQPQLPRQLPARILHNFRELLPCFFLESRYNKHACINSVHSVKVTLVLLLVVLFKEKETDHPAFTYPIPPHPTRQEKYINECMQT